MGGGTEKICVGVSGKMKYGKWGPAKNINMPLGSLYSQLAQLVTNW